MTYQNKGDNVKDDTIEAEIVEDTQVVLSAIKYPVSTTDLDALLEEYSDIPEIDPDADEDLVGEQYQFVLKGHKAFVKARNQIEKTRKELKAPALDYGKTVDGIAKEFQLKIKATEDKLSFQRKLVEDNEARKQREAEEKEELRIDEIKSKILDIKNLALTHFNSDSESLTKVLESLRVPSEEMFNEFLSEAREAQQISIIQLQEMHKSKVAAERVDELEAERSAEAKRIQDEKDEEMRLEREEFKRQQIEFQNKQDEFARQQQAAQEETNRKEAERLADELQKKQDAEKVNRDKAEREFHQERYNETCEDLEALGVENYTIVADALFNNEIRNVKWEANHE